MAGCIVMVVTSIPSLLRNGAGIGGLATSMVLIGLGTGGVKATISPFIGKVVLSALETFGLNHYF